MNNDVKIKNLDKKRFAALMGYSNQPYFGEEVGWYSNEDESVIGVIVLDDVDNDYGAVAIGKDEVGRYRAFNIDVSYQTFEMASSWLVNIIKWNTLLDRKIFPQGNTDKVMDLFKVGKFQKLHPYFIHLQQDKAFFSAREIIKKVTPYFFDIDGNFVEQFQTTGFESRLWELSLYLYLVEDGLYIRRENCAPDFMVEKFGQQIAIEAFVVSRKADNPPRYFNVVTPDNFDGFGEKGDENAMSIRYGSSLYSKLQKKYWELPHVKNRPLIFSIADFHDDQSMLWSQNALIKYLYGFDHDFYYRDSNQLVIKPIKIESHKYGNKEIPSGFFFQPDSEFISGVMFSACATLSKFNRMGRQAGFKEAGIEMIRLLSYHDHDPNASIPKIAQYEVDENSRETWGEGFSIFHNPNAKYPIDRHLFPSIAHHYLQDGYIVSYLPEIYVYNSVTLNILVR